jgi:hypothetical protein
MTISLTCPQGGQYYVCPPNSLQKFIGCCDSKIDPCQWACPAGNVRPAAFEKGLYGTFPNATCNAEGSHFYSCKRDDSDNTFWGCCKGNTSPCGGDGEEILGCGHDLTPASLDQDTQWKAYWTGEVTSKAATRTGRATKTDSPTTITSTIRSTTTFTDSGGATKVSSARTTQTSFDDPLSLLPTTSQKGETRTTKPEPSTLSTITLSSPPTTTQTTTSPPAPTHPPRGYTAAIAGGVAGGTIALFAVVMVMLVIYARHAKRSRESHTYAGGGVGGFGDRFTRNRWHGSRNNIARNY